MTRVLIALGLAGPAMAAPTTLTHSMRVVDMAGNPVNGATPVEVSLWSDETSINTADRLWLQPSSPNLQSGYVTLTLDDDGSGNLVQDTWFAADVWIEVRVDGELFGARAKVGSVPRAAAVSSVHGAVWTSPYSGQSVNEFPTEMMVTSSTTDGSISFGGDTGLVAATKWCQDTFNDANARVCRTLDIERFMATDSFERFGDSGTGRFELPNDTSYWVSHQAADLYQNSIPESSHNYGDCDGYTSHSRVRRAMAYQSRDPDYPLGRVIDTRCDSLYRILCCR